VKALKRHDDCHRDGQKEHDLRELLFHVSLLPACDPGYCTPPGVGHSKWSDNAAKKS
jgi:hypothetical protein